MALLGATGVFGSSRILGKIIDLMVNTETLKDNREVGKALTGEWFEILAMMIDKPPCVAAALEARAKTSRTDLVGYESQLKTTMTLYKPLGAASFGMGP